MRSRTHHRTPFRGLARRSLVLCAVLALVAAPATAAPQEPPPRAETDSAQAPPPTEHRVTLITGDRVRFAGERVLSVEPGPGRERSVVRSHARDGRLRVVPADAAPLLGAGRLDPRLFDVTGLVEAGYDDARRDDVPLIVTGPDGAGAIGAAGRELPLLGGRATSVAKADASAAWRELLAGPAERKVWLDGVRRTSLDGSTKQIGAPSAWADGVTGAGVTVAVLDTGIDDAHPDLAGSVVGRANFTDEPDGDLVGHGTHVAATTASRGERYRGVAPGAELLDGKVCGTAGCTESSIVDGMSWAVAQGADVVNLSLGGPDTPETDPLEAAVELLSDRALFVVAAGNGGRPGSVESPGSADSALTVGAVDRQDGLAPFSSRGPRTGDRAVKPDLTAPGAGVVAARSATAIVGEPVGEAHAAMSGTSMATPHVAGSAALLLQRRPDWTGQRVKAALVGSARPTEGLTAFEQGAGRVDVAAAGAVRVTAEPASLALGSQRWPHEDDAPVTRDLVYRNDSDAPVELSLAAEVLDPDGGPSAVVSVSPTTLSVPAGGRASARVTADTRPSAPDGLHVGAVVASGGPVPLRTALSVEREPESHDVAFTVLDDGGAPASDYYASVIGLDNEVFAFPHDPDGAFTLRLPRGDYYASADVTSPGGAVAVLPRPALSVRAATSVVLDARAARPVAITAPDPAAREALGDITVVRRQGERQVSSSTAFLGGFGAEVSIAHSGPALPDEQVTALIGAQLRGEPEDGLPVTYRLAWVEQGRLPTGFTRRVDEGELARVRADNGPGPADRTFGRGANPVTPDGVGGWAWQAPVTAPGSALDLVTTADTAWSWNLLQHDPTGSAEAALTSPERSYRPGSSQVERFNDPVFSPALPPSRAPLLSRSGDVLSLAVPVFGDGAGNGGSSNAASARTVLLRDGVPVGESPYGANGLFPVEPGDARYRVETDVVRAEGVSGFTRRVVAAWEFASGSTSEPTALPLTAVRFAPALRDGTTPPGATEVPLVVQQHAAEGVRDLAAQVSFDGGATWSAAPVSGGAARFTAPEDGSVSLRVTGSDSAGNRFELAVVDAWRIG
ncbi:S8 family serine peptidase [Actinosynnema pretiosum]|uniref:S8 family serine peptidase n=1 Tax=Actinosynnema pretiosum TaxID=42197 RepID=UPI001E3319BE|nr:S8 family serine peptidase [Actinosynnema pretiosum]